MKKVWVIVIIALIIGSYFAGVYTTVNHTFPYSNLKFIYKQINFNENEMDLDVDVNSFIHIKTIEDIQNTRNELVDLIWNKNGLPKNLPNSIQENYQDKRYDDLQNLKNIEKIEVIMDYDVNSIAYLFVPKVSNDEVVIYHQGHSGDFINGKNTIQFFLKNNYSVLAFSMPLNGMNNQPTIESDNFGKIHLKNHNSFNFIESKQFSPIKFFVEPIFVSLNYLEQSHSFISYHMVGISGGGWTTALYPSIDQRISQSFSVAGSYPIFLRTSNSLIGDYEQSIPELYRIANYLDLYVMNSYGNDRKFVQIFNKFDPCCFSGLGYESYELILKDRINNIPPSNFMIFLDDSHNEHKISNVALNLILNELNN
jgi:hypothetical protein